MASNSKLPRGVFINPRSPYYWISYVDAKGKRQRKAVPGAQTPAEAADIRAAELFRTQQARVLGVAPPSKDAFDVVADRFLKHQKARLTPDAFEREKSIIDLHIKPAFKVKVGAIRPVDIQQYVTARINEKASPATAAKELNVVKHLLRLGVEWELIPRNPAHGVKAPKAPAGRVRYLQPGELKVLMGKCPEWLRAFSMILVTTGMRRGELLNMRLLDVDAAHNRVMLPQTKNGEGRVIYLNRTASTALASVPVAADAKPTDRVFPSITPHQVSVAFRRAVKAAGIEDFRLHDLRHTAASWLRMKGADIHTVASLLGHKDLRMAARYSHLAPDFLQDAVNSLDQVFGQKTRRLLKSGHTSVIQEKGNQQKACK